MLGAILLVHAKAGFFNPNGYEFTLSLLASTLVLTLTGAGAYSIDALIGRRTTSELATGDRSAETVRRAA
jgi:putative oxidoreductase